MQVERKKFFFEKRTKKLLLVWRRLVSAAGDEIKQTRHCERSEAIRLFVPPHRKWIASLRSQ
jgi:hypothetical protein